MSQDRDGDEEGDEADAPHGRDVPLLVGGMERVPAGHGRVERNGLAVVAVLISKNIRKLLTFKV